MRCTNCSAIVKPIVALDIDGTLGDYHGHFLDFAEAWLGRDLRRDYQGKGGFRFWFTQYNYASTEEFRAIKLAYRQGGQKRSMPVYDGAVNLYHTIIDHDAELWFTTTRPYLSLDTVIPDTVHWLARNGMTDYDGMLFDEDKYTQLAARVDSDRVVAVFDDLPDMCHAAAFALYFGHDVPVLVRNPYNGGVMYPNTVTIEQARKVSDERIRWWREEYAA